MTLFSVSITRQWALRPPRVKRPGTKPAYRRVRILARSGLAFPLLSCAALLWAPGSQGKAHRTSLVLSCEDLMALSCVCICDSLKVRFRKRTPAINDGSSELPVTRDKQVKWRVAVAQQT